MRDKFFLLTVFLFAFSCGIGDKKVHEKDPLMAIQKVEIENGLIKNSIVAYRDSFEIGNYPIKLELKESGEVTRYYLSYLANKSELTNKTPSFYSELDGSIVFIYTGIEPYISLDVGNKSLLDSLSSRFLINDEDHIGGNFQVPLIYHPVYWYIELYDGKISKKSFRVSELPREDFQGKYIEEDTMLLEN